MSINPVEIFGGVVQGTAFSALYAGVDDLIAKNHIFRPLFKDVKSRLDTLKPLIKEMAGSNQQLSYTNKDELKGLDKVLKVGEELVLKCSKVSRWDLYRKYKYATNLLAWEEHLNKELEVLQVQGIRDGKKTAVSVDQISSTLGEVNQMIKAKLVIQDHHSTAESKAWCAVPELPQLTVGLEAPLEELKRKILDDGGVSMIVVTAPGGCGKTTLATKFCQDQQVKDKFKDNIFFVTVSKKPSLDLIVQQLYRHKGSQQVPTYFHNEVHAVQWLQTFLKEEGKKPLLLVLDDVWSGSESLLDKFQCRMTMYKILVTSRSEFPGFSSPYHLPMLGYEDAMKLFHHAASLGDKSSHIPPHLSKKIVERCKGFPLAITVVGRSLCGKPVEIWQKREIEWSKGSLILDSETDLLLSLQSSLDALDKENAIIKECFLDLGSFREDARTSVNALIDMWAELYDLEETVCIANLYELHSRSLANLDRRRVKANGDGGYYNEHWISQHDLLRELATYHSKLEPIEQRKRLIIEICGDRLPKWWREHKYQLIKARLLSITIDGELSTTKWPNMQLPETEVLVLNLRKPKTYALPEFVEKMDKLKVLVVTNDVYSNTKLSNFQLLSSLTNLKRIRLESISICSITENPLQLKSLRKISFFNCAISEAFTDCSFKLSHAFPNLEEVNFHASPAFWKFPADFCDLIYVKKLLFIKEILLSALPEEIGNLVNLEVVKLSASVRLSKLPHLFRDCPKASAIWTSIGGPITMRRTFELDWNAWIAANILQRNCRFLDHNWSQIFIFTCWFIWKWRNKYAFDANFKGHNNAVSSIMQYIFEWNNATTKNNCQSDTNVTPLLWEKPDFGVFKLNVDGTRSLSGMIGAGGVIRDYNGNWCHGFMRNIGKGEVLQAEAWGLFTGLQIAKELQITHLMVESDSAVLISLIHSSQLQLHPLGTLLMNCKSIMSNFNHCSVSHIHRERNMVADCLAKKSINHELGLCRLTTMPSFVRSSVLDDLGGLVRLRSLRVAPATL